MNSFIDTSESINIAIDIDARIVPAMKLNALDANSSEDGFIKNTLTPPTQASVSVAYTSPAHEVRGVLGLVNTNASVA